VPVFRLLCPTTSATGYPSCRCHIDGVLAGSEAVGAGGGVCLISGLGGLLVEGAATVCEAETEGVSGGMQLIGVLGGSPGLGSLGSSGIPCDGSGRGITVGPITWQFAAGLVAVRWLESV
jgi:hypothetical protein